MTGFAELPGRIAALTREHERVAVVLLDAFGWAFVQRHADHPFLQRLEIEPVASQFPSTTTAHLTTLYTGLPVAEHGLYEWVVYEPALDATIIPLPFVSAATGAAGPRPAGRRPRPDAVRTARGAVARAAAGADRDRQVQPGGVRGRDRRAVRALRARRARLAATPGLTHLYWDRIDAAGHRYGPAHAEFVAASLAALDALATVRDTFVVVTADHGQIEVGPIDYLDSSGRRCSSTCATRPPGSARDCFLHVTDPETVVAELAAALGERAEVRLAAELFPRRRPAPAGPAGRRLRAPRARPDGVAGAPIPRASSSSAATTAA